MPNLQLTLSNQLSKGATKTALTMSELITTMKSAGMSNVAIRQTLLNDLNTGGQLFGAFKNNLKNTIKNGVEISSNDSANKEFTDAGIEEFRWVSIGDNSVCPDCAGRSGEVGTLEYHETLGLPASGFSVCQGNCRCKLVPIDYKGEDFDKPLIRKEKKPIIPIPSTSKELKKVKSSPVKKFDVKSPEDFAKKMGSLSSKDNKVYTASATFGTVYIKEHKYKSAISQAVIESSVPNYKGYWQNGRFYKYSKSFVEQKNKENINIKKKKRAVFGGG